MPTIPASPRRSRTAVLLAIAIMYSGSVSATPFTITSNSTTAQTLGSGIGQAGTVAAGASLTLGGGTVAVTVSGNNATLNNLGTIAQTGTGRAVRDNTGVTGLVVNNGSSTNAGAIMRTADADVIQMNVPAASVVLNNYGAMISLNASAGGAQAVDFSAMSGANTINNYAGGVMSASEADAVRPGANGVLFNAGTIRSTSATGSSSDGIDGQANSGIQITNTGAGLVEGARHGITAGQATAASNFTLNITNNAGAVIRGNNGSGVNVDGFNARQVVTVVNHGSIIGSGSTGDGDGLDVDGIANITNTGLIRSVNAVSAPANGLAFSEGVSIGGGTVVNAGTIEGLVSAGNTNAVGRGITLAGNDIASGPLAGTREGLYGNATIVNQAGGLIRGSSDSAIVAQAAASGFTVVVNNNAGATILGGGAANAAIRTGADNTTIVNAGSIDGASSGKAIEMGSGHSALVIKGGSASIVGSIDGGSGGANTLVVDAGAGGSFAYAGTISRFASVTVQSGDLTLSGQNNYSGDTIINGGSLTLVGANRIASSSALVLNGGLLNIVGIGSGGQTFASLSLQSDSTVYFSDTPLTFNGLGSIVAGKVLTLTDTLGAPGVGMRFLGDMGANADFLALVGATRFGSAAATFNFDGIYTNVAPVPEPGSIALVLGGLALLTRARRRPTA